MRTSVIVTLIGAVALSSCGKKRESSSPGTPSAQTATAGTEATQSPGTPSAVTGPPVETRDPEASDQKPAFAGQTRAPLRSAKVAFDVQKVAGELEHPWGVAFLPGNQMLVTERPGRMRILGKDGSRTEPVQGLPRVDARNQGGLLDVVLDPAHESNGLIYWSYSEPREGGNGTAVARARLIRNTQPPRLEALQVIWRMMPTLDSKMHFGSRLVFGRDGTLFITTGERSIEEGRVQAQRLDSSFGKVIRVNPDGSVPKDNPFVGKANVQPEIYSYGHRNIQSAALHPATGKLWIVEHGAKGGDEVNLIEPGKNYGWPIITYGVEYSGGTIGEGKTAAPNMEQPLYYWDPVIAPSGMAFYTGELFPAWKGSLFVGGLAAKHVARLTLDGTRVIGEERLLEGRARFRDVRVGPDQALYLLTDDDEGELLKLVPAEARGAAQ